MSCTPSPTSTRFGTTEFVTNSISHSDSTSVSTAPPTTTTTTTTSCADPAPSPSQTCTSEIVITLTSTFPGFTTTITNQVPITIPVTLTSSFPTETLFSTCPTSDPTQPTDTGTNSTSFSTSETQTTLPNGSISTQTVTFTNIVPTETVTQSPSPGLNNSGNRSSTANSNIGPIVGGALGGFLGLLLLAGAFLFWRRRRRWDDIYEKGSIHGVDDDDRPVQAPEPAPYHYGLVGHHRNPSASPPNSPNSRPMTFHSRVESSGGVSVVSRESTIPLNQGDSLGVQSDGRPVGHNRKLSQGEGWLLTRPLDPVTQSGLLPETRLKSNPSSPPISPVTPRQTFYPLRVTNINESDAGPSQTQVVSPKSPRSQRSSSQSPVLIHLDGGRVETSGEGGSNGAADDNPPAYSKRG